MPLAQEQDAGSQHAKWRIEICAILTSAESQQRPEQQAYGEGSTKDPSCNAEVVIGCERMCLLPLLEVEDLRHVSEADEQRSKDSPDAQPLKDADVWDIHEARDAPAEAPKAGGVFVHGFERG